MYDTHTLGTLTLQLFRQFKNQVSITDFCATASTIEFTARDGFLENNLTFFSLSFPGFKLESGCSEGTVFIRRNESYQQSKQIRGKNAVRVAIQWDIESIGCGVAPWTGDPNVMQAHMQAMRTPYTVPPLELHRTLRAHNLLDGNAYKSADDVFSTVLDCLRLCEEDIRRFGAERYIWKKEGDADRPLDEPEISRFVASFLAPHGAARNFDVSCETVAGGGNVDFWIVAPVSGAGLAKIAIEAKKADNTKFVHGFSVQLPAYMNRLKCQHGIYLVYWLKSASYPRPSHASYAELEIDVLHPLQRAPGVRSIGIDLSKISSPSRI